MLLDFDGTLVPLQDDPDQVKLDPDVRLLLQRLAGNPRMIVYIVSGRGLADLRKIVCIQGVHLLGMHGWERPGSSLPPEQREALRAAQRWLELRLPKSPRIRVEDKGAGLTVHHRGASLSATRLAYRVTRQVLDLFQPTLHLVSGKKIWELLPEAIGGKGQATLRLLEELPSGTLPIVIGDDTTDEMAFRALRNGLTLRVGRTAKTKASLWLRNPAEVREFLERLEAVAHKESPGASSTSGPRNARCPIRG